MLFTDVVNCIQTQNIELKKLVYLYLINYAKSQPDLAILAVNAMGPQARAASVCNTLRPSRTRWTRTRSSARWLCARWAASASTRSSSTSVASPGAPRALPFPAASDFTLPRSA